MSYNDWSTIAANNVLANIGITFDEGWAPSAVNNSMRALIAQMATELGNYPAAGTKNLLINGDFEVWQRGAGGAALIAVAASTTAYTADRWYITTGANQASTIQQIGGLVNSSRFCARVFRNSGQTGTGTVVFGQPFTTDQAMRMRGIKVAISAAVRTGANFSPTSGNLTMSLYVGTGTQGKRGAGFTGETTPCTVTTALGTGSAVTAISALSAAVVPTTTQQAELQFAWTPTGTAGVNDYFDVDICQVEFGGVASRFCWEPFDITYERCLQFYAKTFNYGTAPAVGSTAVGGLTVFSGTGVSGAEGLTWLFPAPMRTAPTVTTYNPVSANANWRDTTNNADRVVTVGTAGEKGVGISLAAGAAASTNIIQAQAEADL